MKISKTILNSSLVLLAAFFAGVLGAIFANAYFISSTSGIPLFGAIDISKSDWPGGGIVIRDAKKVVVEQGIQARDVASQAANTFVWIARKDPAQKNTGEATSSQSFLPGYDLSVPAARGFMATEDGWAVFAGTAPEASERLMKDYVGITADRSVYQLEKAVAIKDAGIYYVKLRASGLAVAAFSEVTAVSGDALVAASHAGYVMTAGVIRGRSQASAPISARLTGENPILVTNLPKELAGGALMSFSGQIISLIGEDMRLRDARLAAYHLRNYLSGGKTTAPDLGFSYLLLENYAGSKEKQGGLVVAGADGIAVKPGGPADLAGLENGDIIINANGIPVSQDMNISDALFRLKSGGKVELAIKRKGKDAKVSIDPSVGTKR